MLAEMTMNKSFNTLRVRVSGLTLVEILVGLGVLSILLALAAPSMVDLLERRRVIAAADEVAGILTYAKAETNSTNAVLYTRFDPDPNGKMSCAAVVTASSLNRCKCYLSAANICPTGSSKSLRLFQLPLSYVSFSAAAAAWNGPTHQIMFSPGRATIATEGFHVDVVGKKRGYALRIDVNTAGRVKICSPNGDMSGYVRCV